MSILALNINQITVNSLNGLYSLNDLHKASGAEDKHKPAFFLRNEQTKEVITELHICNSPENTLAVKRGGVNQGTWACKELVYSYAMWISAKFHLLVIRAFDNLGRTTAKQREIFITACDKLSINNKLRSKVYTDVANHFGYEKPVDMPVDILPEAIAYVYEELLAQEKARKSEEKPSIIHQDAQVMLEIGYHANNEAWQYIKGLENELKSALSMIGKLGNLNQITGSSYADIEVGIPCSLDQRRKARELAGYAIENYREKGMMSLAYQY